MSSKTETWVADGPSALWACVHEPEPATARGVVLVVPPLGLEAVTTARGQLVLAHRLAQEGFVAVRFSWSGEGDSAPRAAGAPVGEACRADFATMTAWAQALAPGAPLTAVGLRSGAAVIDPGLVDHVVLWEPLGGRGHIRSQEILRKVSIPLPSLSDDRVTEVCGDLWTEEDRRSIGDLKVPRKAPKVRLDDEESHLFLEVPPMDAVVPRRSIEEVVTQVPLGPATPRLPWHRVEEISFDVAGKTVVERLTTIEPHGLPAVLTLPAEQPRAVVVLTAPGAEPRHAPVGLWSQTARQIAATRAAATVRADRRGLGELSDPEADRSPEIYTAVAVEDVVTTSRAARDLVPGVPLVPTGSCVGAWLHLRASRDVRPEAIEAVENAAWVSEWDQAPRFFDEEAGSEAPATPGLIARLRSTPRAGEDEILKQRAIAVLLRTKRVVAVALGAAAERLPGAAWRLLGRLGVVQDPIVLLSTCPPSTRVRLLMGRQAGGYLVRSGGVSAVRELRRRGAQVEIHDEESIDHSLFTHAGRRAMVADLELLLASLDR